ncbi:MAG: hypothetical protein IKS41_01650 [Alphaproteobacteria bacterium]|nr:hypothetical protein [Alphaproteobacteria bacterium]
MFELNLKEKIILYTVWGMFIILLIFIGFVITYEQLLALIGVGIFIFILFLFFHLYDKLSRKYIKLSYKDKKRLVSMNIKSKRRICYYAEKHNQPAEETKRVLELNTYLFKENPLLLSGFKKVILTFLFSLIIGDLAEKYAKHVLAESNYPSPSGMTPAMFIGTVAGSICFTLISLFFLIRFFFKVRKGMKEAQENDIITRQ